MLISKKLPVQSTYPKKAKFFRSPLPYILLGANVLIALIIAAVIAWPTIAPQAAGNPQDPSLAVQSIIAPQLGVASEPQTSVPQVTVLQSVEPIVFPSIAYMPKASLEASNQADGSGSTGWYEPPVEDRGGTCIMGTAINIYEMSLGPGWTVTVTQVSPNNGMVWVMETDLGGAFRLDNLKAGTYRVTIEVPDGWRPHTPHTFEVTLDGDAGNAKCSQVRFKLMALACLDAIKQDNNGALGLGHRVGIPGWSITATYADGTKLQVQTDGEGKAYFRNLLPGTWTIEELPQIGWAPVAGFPSKVTMTLESPPWPCDPTQTVTFVNEQAENSGIAVKKVDIWGNPLANWNITVTRVDGTQPPQFGTTDAYGLVYFQNLTLGEWDVSETIKPYWAVVGNATVRVNLTEPMAGLVLVTFTNEPLGCVKGYKINHLDEGMGNWTVTARNSETGLAYQTVTDATGFFRFDNLKLGEWIISEDVEEDWTAVTPSEFTVEVTTPFEPCTDVRFKNRIDYGCLDVYKKDSYDLVGLPGWIITIQPAYGGTPQTGVTDGNGWVRFNGLPPGDYYVTETPQAEWVTDQVLPLFVDDLEASGRCREVEIFNHQINRTPPTPVSATPVPGSVSCSQTYTIQRGDTLSGIARRFNVTLMSLKNANNIANVNLIYPGTELCIPNPYRGLYAAPKGDINVELQIGADDVNLVDK